MELNTIQKTYTADNSGISLQETLWGHRFLADQTPSLILLECLSIIYSVASERPDELFNEPEGYKPVNYQFSFQPALRYLLFNNPELVKIASSSLSESAKWDQLEKSMQMSGWCNSPGYLRDRFKSFSDLMALIEFFQATAIEAKSSKRWTSKFVFPYGENCSYMDGRAKGNNINNDYRFFSRGGELVYLMLCRSIHADKLKESVLQKIIDKKSRFNDLIKALSDPNCGKRSDRDTGYLPYETRPEYDHLAEDWIRILNCKLPSEEVIEQLASITCLQLSLYFINTSNAVLNPGVWTQESANHPDTIVVVDCDSSYIGGVQAAATVSFTRNDQLSLRAIEFASRSLKDSPDWVAISNSNDPLLEASRYLGRHYCWDVSDSKLREKLPFKPTNVDKLLELFERAGVDKHKMALKGCYRMWVREIGMLSVRKGRKPRYVIGDELLKTLVYVVVENEMELTQFMSILKKRYAIVIGEKEIVGTPFQQQVDAEDLNHNSVMLANRLMALGLLKQLSDSCAYVRNPFAARITEAV